MPSYCLACGQNFQHLYMWCPECQGMCKSTATYGLTEMLSDAPVIKDQKRPQKFYQGKQSGKYHTKRDPSGPTQAQVLGQTRGGRPAKLEIKTQRQAGTLARHVTRFNEGEGKLIATYTTSQKVLVQIYMLPSSSPMGAPSFYGIKEDGVTFPMDPSSKEIPEIYRADSSNYNSDSDNDDF
ncbi:MAG TPA: hypothetical protein VN030_06375 [Cellvibrio sp.]|nr:hypothetical protein [Cellvibrio sp.]